MGFFLFSREHICFFLAFIFFPVVALWSLWLPESMARADTEDQRIELKKAKLIKKATHSSETREWDDREVA